MIDFWNKVRAEKAFGVELSAYIDACEAKYNQLGYDKDTNKKRNFEQWLKHLRLFMDYQFSGLPKLQIAQKEKIKRSALDYSIKIIVEKLEIKVRASLDRARPQKKHM